MTVWTVLAGTLAAAGLAWVAIAGFAWLGELRPRTGPIRAFGAAALGCLALAVAGVPVPWAIAPSLLGLGLLVGFAWPVLEDSLG